MSTIGFGSLITYQPEPFKSYHLQDDTPVLVCPFPSGREQYLVIDGNHRVSARGVNRQPVVRTILCELDYMKCFLSPLDYAYYRFAVESNENSVLGEAGADMNVLISSSSLYLEDWPG